MCVANVYEVGVKDIETIARGKSSAGEIPTTFSTALQQMSGSGGLHLAARSTPSSQSAPAARQRRTTTSQPTFQSSHSPCLFAHTIDILHPTHLAETSGTGSIHTHHRPTRHLRHGQSTGLRSRCGDGGQGELPTWYVRFPAVYALILFRNTCPRDYLLFQVHTLRLTTSPAFSYFTLSIQTTLPRPPFPTNRHQPVAPPRPRHDQLRINQHPSPLPKPREASRTNAQHVPQTPQRHARQLDQLAPSTELRGESPRHLWRGAGEGSAEAAPLGWVREAEGRGDDAGC